jgi:NAD-dependent deacetylase
LKASCVSCAAVLEWHGDLSVGLACPACGARGGLRPHVVWFGEMPLEMDRIAEALEACRLFVSIGTSGVVYPAAGFVQTVRARGLAHTVELNLEPSAGHGLFAEAVYGPASSVVPRFVHRLLDGDR